MKQGIDIHDYQRRLETSVARVQRSNISEENKRHIMRFKDFCIAEGSIGTARTERYMGILDKWAQLIKTDFNKAGKEDIMQAVSVIQGNNNYSPWTKATYKIMLKRFYKWLKNSKTMPEQVEWISGKVKRNEVTLPAHGELLTEDDIKRLIKICEHPRDKALIATLYESGMRVGELATMQIKNITFDKYGAVLNVHGKTGPRMIRVVASTSYLTTWMQNHPQADNPNAPLWINIGTKNHGHVMPYRTIWFLLRDTIKKSGLSKRANPHIFRHSRATFLANHLTEFQMNQYFGWIQGSDMPATYVHMSGKSLDTSILALNGLTKPGEAKQSTFIPRECPRCETLNSHDAKFCIKCAAILDIRMAIEMEEQSKKQIENRNTSDNIMNRLMQDSEFAAILTKKLQELSQ